MEVSCCRREAPGKSLEPSISICSSYFRFLLRKLRFNSDKTLLCPLEQVMKYFEMEDKVMIIIHVMDFVLNRIDLTYDGINKFTFSKSDRIFPRYVYWRYHKLQYTFKVFDLRYDRPKVDFLLSVLEASPFQVQDGRRRQSPYSLNKAVASSSSIRPIDP
ncbi:hypothetical protein V1477_016805 [Vespula maculifrons]|uniref:Uncharacterized protein n=1 Tax=Vespula maculifrons TaxID=7453 RepID=A0ABD2B465_VESMC